MPRKIGASLGSKLLTIAAIILSVMIGGAFCVSQLARQDAAMAQAERELSSKADLLAGHMARIFEMAGGNLRAVAKVRDVSVSNAFTAQQMHAALAAVHANSPVFISLIWTDAAGERIATSFSANPLEANLADREHFTVPKADRTFNDRPFIGRPVYAQALKSWIIGVTLRLEDASGAFAGVAAGSIDPQYLSEEFARAGLGGSGYVRLVRGDQVLLSQHPYSAEELGRIVPSAAGEAGGSRFQFEPISEDGQIVVVAAVSNSDMFVVAAQSQDAALAHHWVAFWQEFAIVAGLIVALAVGAVFLVFEMRRREKAEVAVRLQEERSRAYAQASNDWFWETDSGLRFVWVSRSVEISLGLRSSWFIGKQFEDVIQTGKSAEFEAQWRSLGARQSFHDLECDVAGKHGRRTILVSGIPYFDDAGAFKGYRGSTKDVTAWRLTEQNLRDAIRSFPGRVMIFDRNERLTLFNNGSNAPLDSVASQLRKGDSFERILHKLVDAGIIEDANDDPAAWIAERLRRFRRRERGVILRIGGKVVEATDAPMADGGTISLRFDVTERELARERAEAARRDAERANQAKSEFLASMSHEFRTPLNAIIGFSQLLLMDKASSMSSDEKEYVAIVESSGRHLLNLVSEILDLSGVEAGRLKLSIEAVEIGDVLQQVISSMGPAADKAGIHLRFERAATKIFARADIQRLRQVLMNLVSNAIKYNKPGGFVEVSAGKFENKIRISVIDNGIGIAREHHEHVFDAFNRLGAERSGIEGVGIGLSLSRQLVWAMSGDIGFASNQDRGMTFWIEVPVSAAHEYGGSGLDSPSLEVGRRLGGYSLLCIEDHPSSQSLMKSLVATLDDVHLISAPSGPIGLELALAHCPDVIVLDLNLPEMDGYAILKALQSRPETWSTPVLALTAAASSKEVESGLAAGFFRYLTKPVDVMEFLDAVDAAMQAINRTTDSSNSRGVKVERLGDRVSDATSSSSH